MTTLSAGISRQHDVFIHSQFCRNKKYQHPGQLHSELSLCLPKTNAQGRKERGVREVLPSAASITSSSILN